MSANDTHRLDSIAEQFGLQLHGDGSRVVSGVGTLASATETQLAFLANPRYTNQLAQCKAAAVIVGPRHVRAQTDPNLLQAEDAYVAYAHVASLFERRAAPEPGIHPSAIIAADASISAEASIGPFCLVGARSVIAAGVEIGAHGSIGDDCVIGSQSRLAPRVTLMAGVSLGQRVLIHAGAVLGADGFGLAFEHGQWRKVPQLGGVRVGDDCEIGANTCIDRGSIEDTVLGNDVRLDNQIQIAHNVIIGDHTAVAGCAAVAGSARIGRFCLVGGGAGILGHLDIADHVTITAMSLVTHSIKTPGEYSSGSPLQETRQWRRNAVRLKQLDNLAHRVATLEKHRSND